MSKSHDVAATQPSRASTWAMPSRRAGMPERVGRYRIVRRISRGGMAQVFEAVLEGRGGFARRFAVKLPLPGTSIPDLAAFADEARILSQLHHPGIVGVVDFGAHEGWPYQVLEYVDGPDLALLRVLLGPHGGVPASLALMTVLQAAHALHFAHEARDWQGHPLGIVHRDVSPHNILVSWSGDVKLIDFGIAKAEGRMVKTEEGIVKGKLLYMAPEQIAGQRVTPRADVFSLGCVLYFMLTGDSPYAVVDESARAARDLRPTRIHALDPDVAAIVETAIALRPEGRHASALELADECERAVARRPDATVGTLARCLAGLRSSVPQRGAPGPRKSSSVMVVGIDPQEEAPTAIDMDLMRSTRAVATAEARVAGPKPTVGRFRIIGALPLGEGLHEAVAVGAESEHFGLRRISCSGASPEAIARRLADAAGMSTVDHDHLLRVLEFGVDAGALFIVVPKPQGHALHRVMRDAGRAGGLDVEEIFALASGMISAVRAARDAVRCMPSAEIARDVRAETFLVGHDGFLKLMDTIVDGPLHGVRDPRRSEAHALASLISTLPPARGAEGSLRDAIERLRDDSCPNALSRAILTLRHGVGSAGARPAARILSDLMLRLYAADAAEAQAAMSRALRAPSAVNDTAPLPSRSIDPDEDALLITELDPEALVELAD